MGVNETIASIDRLTAEGRYEEARDRLRLLEIDVTASDRTAFSYAALAIDIGNLCPNRDLLERGLEITRSLKDRFSKTEEMYGLCCYNLANALETKVKWKQHSSDHHYCVGDPELEEAKANYREAIETLNDQQPTKPMIWVNYGNLLNGRTGRCLEAFECYERALSLHPDFAMALANKGYAQRLFAGVIGGDAGKVLLLEAYNLVRQGLTEGIERGPHRFFKSLLSDIKKLFPKPEDLNVPIECRNSLELKERSFRDFYRNFCHKERLYLNPLGRNHRCEAALCDPLVLKRMITDVNDNKTFFRFSAFLNQIKQEFVTARFLAAQSYFMDPGLKFVDEGVTLINTLDYPVYGIFVELAKTAFRLAYSLLDKVAFVLNDYLNLGMEPKSLYFYNLAPLKNKKILEHQKPTQNPYVGALLDLANDFENGHLEELRELRRAFEHRFLTIHQDFIPTSSLLEYIANCKDNNKGNLKLLKPPEFREQMLKMLRLTKAAIFYLVLLIDWEERSNEAQSLGVLVPMRAGNIPDHLKGEL